jgi:gamma-glutamylcysteine synthetase
MTKFYLVRTKLFNLVELVYTQDEHAYTSFDFPSLTYKRLDIEFINEPLIYPTTIDQFNTKYKQYLEEGYWGLDIDCLPSIHYLDTIFKQLLTKLDGFQYSTIKIKFQSSRFYFKLDENFDFKMKECISNLIEEELTRLYNITGILI